MQIKPIGSYARVHRSVKEMPEWMITWDNGYNDLHESFTDKTLALIKFKEISKRYWYSYPCMYKLVKRYSK